METNSNLKFEIEQKYNSNIWKIYLMKAIRCFLLIMPTMVLFFTENGLNMKEVLFLQAIFSISVVIFEIPSGYFADIIGRKNSIIIGSILSTLGMISYSLSYGFIGFLIAEVTLGLGSSFLSGADSAILYDSLLSIGKQDKFKKIVGRFSSIGPFSEGIASIIGGFLAVISLRTPFYLETIILFLTIPLAFSLKEPKREKKEKGKTNPLLDIVKIVKYSLHHHSEVKWLILYSSLVSTSTLTAVWFLQPYMDNAGLPLAFFGIAWAVFNFSTGIFALCSEKYEKILGRKKSLISLIFISSLTYILLGIFNSIFAIGFILLFYFVRGMGNPIFNDYINKIIESDIRATVLSVKNLVGRLLFSIIGPIIGWINDLYSLSTAFIICGGIFLMLGIISLSFMHKNDLL